MIENIGTKGFETISKPSLELLQIIAQMKSETSQPLNVAEIGVGIGATTVEIVRIMEGDGKLFLFDFVDKVETLKSDLQKLETTQGLEIECWGNSRKSFDSYAWTLANLLKQEKKTGHTGEVFDIIYLDGAHTFLHDAAACALLKELLRENGYIVFDDMYWSHVKSPSHNPINNPGVSAGFTDQQLNTPNVELVVDCLVRTDPRFAQVFLTQNRKPYRAVFQKKLEHCDRRNLQRKSTIMTFLELFLQIPICPAVSK